MYISTALVLEYEEVFIRKQEDGFLRQSKQDLRRLVDLICEIGEERSIYYLWRWHHVKDPADAHVLEAAVASPVQFLVTYNQRDFYDLQALRLILQEPKEFLRLCRHAT